MKKTVLLLLPALLFSTFCRAAYNDHRGHDVDSLQRVIATVPRDSSSYFRALEELSVAYRQTDPHYAVILSRQLYDESPAYGKYYEAATGASNISMYYRANGQQDSALVWAQRQLDMTDRMRGSDAYTETQIDDRYSLACGNLGNIYCEMEDYGRAIDYFQKALAIFEKHGWKESSSVLYHNLGYLYDEMGQYRLAESCMLSSLRLGEECGDSLAIAGAHLLLGEFYLERNKSRKALNHLVAADEYFLHHEDQEFMGRLELLDTLSVVRDSQLRLYRLAVLAGVLLVVLALAVAILLHRRHRQEKVIREAAEVLKETIGELPAAQEKTQITLNDREMAILKMLAEGKDSKTMAKELFLSLETIYWYRKRLLAKFDAKTMTEVLSEAMKRGLV